MSPAAKRDARTYVFALGTLSTIAFLVVAGPYLTLLKHMVGTAPESIRGIPGFAYSGMLGMAMGQRKPVNLGMFFRVLGRQVTAGAVGLAFAGTMKAMGAF